MTMMMNGIFKERESRASIVVGGKKKRQEDTEIET
jgi:hypothetical protein